MKKFKFSYLTAAFYWLLIIFLTGLFFTNDFGLVDIHKTSIITAVGIDNVNEEVEVTAEIAVPQPSQSGDAIKYTQVQGSGLTIADALNEINAKTGFYPKLQFCRLILVGDSCKDKELFRMLGCFYRKNYSELTALVAMCEGKASEMLSMKSPVADSTSEAIRKVLSDEIEKSANSSTANLKSIAVSEYSKSRSCYMPFVEANAPGTSEDGGNGDSVGGEDPGQGGGGSSGESGSGSGGGESGSGGSGGESGQGSAGGTAQEVEFTSRKTAIFVGGNFKGILDERQSFALDLVQNDIRLAVLPCDADGLHYTLGLKNIKTGLKLGVKDGEPELTISVSATTQIQGVRVKVEPSKTITDDIVPDSVMDGARRELEDRFDGLMSVCRETDCDFFGLREMLYKRKPGEYEKFKDDLLERMKINYDIKIQSVN